MRTEPDISKCVHRPLLKMAVFLWAVYLVTLVPFSRWLPGGDVQDIVRGVSDGFFGACLIIGSCGAGATVWVSLRVRTRGCILAAFASVPLSILCWCQVYLGFFPCCGISAILA
jgi:hypothetical protein